jgi:hypothetical protein
MAWRTSEGSFGNHPLSLAISPNQSGDRRMIRADVL